jgi:glycerol-3-phosphate acyltransferase PlsX
MADGIVAICDSGSNVDCSPEYLNQFATMGSVYVEKAFGIKNPRVALLNVGVESEKGDLLRKETYQLLTQNKNINFVGNMESRDAISGEYDLIVCDGFSGNVFLKTIEATTNSILYKFTCYFDDSSCNLPWYYGLDSELVTGKYRSSDRKYTYHFCYFRS